MFKIIFLKIVKNTNLKRKIDVEKYTTLSYFLIMKILNSKFQLKYTSYISILHLLLLITNRIIYLMSLLKNQNSFIYSYLLTNLLKVKVSHYNIAYI